MAMTIHDIAREAGVSTATVSRALRGLSSVSPQTRERVLEVAQRLNYVVSPTASRLSTGRTGSIAVITPFIARWYFSTVLSGVEAVLRDTDLDLLLFSVAEYDDEHPGPSLRKIRGRVDGILVISLDPWEPVVHRVQSLHLPTSVIGPSVEGASSVSIDDVEGAATATQHLINLGHERIGLIHGQSNRRFAAEHDRYMGFRKAMSAAGLEVPPELEVPGGFTVSGGEHAMTQLLASPSPPTAVFAISDEMAFGALRALRHHGLRSGHDVSVIGYDNHELAELLDLTTVAQPVTELGAHAARTLLARLDQPELPLSDLRLPTRLVVRGSTRPPRRPLPVPVR